MRQSKYLDWGSLHHDESGQIMILFLFLVLLVLAVLMLNISTGIVIEDKLHTQTAADMGALSGGAWVARTMNHVSMNNVAMTQSLSWILILRGVRETVNKTKPFAIAEEAACCGASMTGIGAIFGGLCCAAATAALIEINILEPVVNSIVYQQLISQDAPISLWKVMKALEYMNDAIVFAYPKISEIDAYWIATRNKADFAVLLPFPKMNLLVANGSFCDLCDPTWNGSPTSHERGYNPLLGYDLHQGPLKSKMEKVKRMFWPMVIVGGPYTFEAFTKASYGALCKKCGASEDSRYDMVTARYSEARSWSNVEASGWFYCEANVGPTIESALTRQERTLPDPYEPNGESAASDIERDPEFSMASPGYLDHVERYHDSRGEKRIIHGLNISPVITSPEYEQLSDGLWNKCTREFITEGNGNEQYMYHIQQYRFAFARSGKSRGGVAPDVSEGMTDNSLPKPMVLSTSDVSELSDLLSYVCVAYKAKSTLPYERYLTNPNDLASLGYAQVLVHNPTAVDLFTQDWRVKLVRTDKLDRVLSTVDDAISYLPTEARSFFPTVADWRMVLGRTLNLVNHH